MQKKIREREEVWNNVRAHQALGQLTSTEYLLKLQNSRIPTKDVIILQTQQVYYVYLDLDTLDV